LIPLETGASPCCSIPGCVGVAAELKKSSLPAPPRNQDPTPPKEIQASKPEDSKTEQPEEKRPPVTSEDGPTERGTGERPVEVQKELPAEKPRETIEVASAASVVDASKPGEPNVSNESAPRMPQPSRNVEKHCSPNVTTWSSTPPRSPHNLGTEGP
jgi:hypothetical protein